MSLRMSRLVRLLPMALLIVGSGGAAAEPATSPTFLRQVRFDRSQELRLSGHVVIDHAVEVPTGVSVTLYTDGQVEFADGFQVRGGGVFSVLSASPLQGSEAAPATVGAPDHDWLIRTQARNGRLEFSLSRPAALNVSIVDVQGRSLLRIASSDFSTGSHGFDLRQLGARAGIYFYRVSTGGVSRQGRVLVIP